jgi:urea transport system permease protein
MATRILTLIALLIAVAFAPLPAQAQTTPATDDFAAQVNALGPGSFADRTKAMDVLVATGDERVPPVLEALSDGDLYIRKADQKVVIATKASGGLAVTDPLDGADLGTLPSSNLEKVKSNNGLRGKIRTAIGKMTLLSPDNPVRLSAAQSILKNADPAMLELLDQALAAETDPSIKSTMELARAVTVLKTDGALDEKRAAVDTVISHNDRAAQNVLINSLAAAP